MPTGSRATSRQRFRAYLERRRRARREGHDGPLATEGSPRAAKRVRTFSQLLRAFWGLLAGRRWLVLAALGTVSVQSGLALMMPASTKVAIDYIILPTPGPTAIPEWVGLPDSLRTLEARPTLLWMLGGALVAIAAVSVTVGMWGRWQMTRLRKQVQAGLGRRVFDHASRLPLHRVQQMRSGGLASILRDDVAGAAEMIFTVLYNPWMALVRLVGALVVLAWVDWRMLLGAMSLIPIVWMTHRTWVSRIRPVFRDVRQTRTEIDAHAAEAFGGIRVVRGFGRQRGEAGRFTRGNQLMIRQEILVWWWSRAVDIAWSLMIPIASAGVLVYCGMAVIRGEMTIGDVMMFTAYVLMLLGPLEVLANSATQMQTNLAGLDRLLDLLEEQHELGGRTGGIVLTRASMLGRVTLADVRFAYPRRTGRRHDPARTETPPPEVIAGVSLDVMPGETIALVGPSGAGKTTLCNLIARFFDPTAGSIAIDGVDLREINVASYRRLLGIVEQEVFLFDGTVTENIAYARRDATPAEIAAAARAANAADFIDALEHGYDTRIGERGVRLSGGQKQRIAIARALLADPAILILDEATSNLDTESERLIQASLARLMRGRTCFVIAHRLSTIRHADRIVVLIDGRIAEVGSHDQLMDGGGRYAELVRLQTADPAPHGPEADGQPAGRAAAS